MRQRIMKLKRQMLYYFTQIESNVRSELLSNLDLERELTKCNYERLSHFRASHC